MKHHWQFHQRNMGQWHVCQYHHISQCFKTGSWSKLPIQLKRKLPHKKAHALWHCLRSALPNTCTNTGWNDFITKSVLWSNMVECSTQELCWLLPHRLVQRLFNGSRNTSTYYCSEYWLTAPRRIFHIPIWKGRFSRWYKNNFVWWWLPKSFL